MYWILLHDVLDHLNKIFVHGEDRLNIKTQLIIGALKFAEFPDHISIDYALTRLLRALRRNRKHNFSNSLIIYEQIIQ